MSRLDELKLRIESLRREKDSYAKRCDQDIATIQKELAALEAESARPREFFIVLGMTDGKPIGLTTKPDDYLQGTIIKAIESKPLVITREMARAINNAWESTPADGNFENPKFWVSVLKAAGIDAIPEGGNG